METPDLRKNRVALGQVASGGRGHRDKRSLESVRVWCPRPGKKWRLGCGGGLRVCCSQRSARPKEEEQPVQNPRRKRRNLDMEKLYNKNEGNLENEGKPEDEVEPDDEGKSDEEEKPDVEGKTECEGKREDEGEPGDEGQLEDEGNQEKQGKSEGEGKPQGEGKPTSQAKPESQPRAAEKRPAEDYVPRKAKRKTDRGTDDSPKDSQEDFQGRHLSSEEMMRECGDVSRAQEELRKKQKMGGFHWMQRDVQDPFAQGANGVSGE
ncbi:LOW QUALITY PROTEIN: transcription elongation factor A protein-like 3 [Aotus nancymaae]|uniref:LOW QUALITY PROTEIN: transcription elongation factor A protein-like 3 n=1 Tax=Aotus nancymaae TaxID=37293 RepID=UPI0030FF2694